MMTPPTPPESVQEQISGVLDRARGCREMDAAGRASPAIVPLRQAGEAQLMEGVDVLSVASIWQMVALLHG